MGVGDNFYFEGKPLQKGYQFLLDFDIPHTYLINHPTHTAFTHNTSFTGGSALTVHQSSAKLLRMLIPKALNLTLKYWLVVTVKDTLSI